jgi:glycosyltransferase involved in cell wall biosynthesis
MKIAMVVQQASHTSYVAELARALRRGGNDVTVYTRRQSADEPPERRVEGGYRLVSVPAGPPKPMPRRDIVPHLGQFAAVLTEDWQRDLPDVVHAHYWMSGVAALLAAAEVQVPVVQTYHALAAVEGRNERRRPGLDDVLPQRMRMERLVGRRAAWVLATCSDEIDELITLGVPRSKTSVVPGGVDCELFVPDELPPKRMGRFRLLSVGPLAPHSGFGDVIVALAKVPAADLVIAGGPPAQDLFADDDAKRLRLLADRVGVADRVRFVGRQPQALRAELMRWADVVVCAPWYEPLGLAALEAMASGTPVIATDVGCLRDSVVHGVTGEHVPKHRPDALAAALHRLSIDLVSLQEYGVAGRDRAKSRFAWDRIATDTIRIYDQVR